MALAPINPTNLTPPRVEFIDPRTGAISREWYRFFLSLLTATEANQAETVLAPDVQSLLATYDALLASATQASETASDGMVASLESSLNNLQNAFGVTPPDLGGTVTSVAASGGLTGLTFTGSPITTSGTLTLGGTLGVGYGGTGQTSYTDGQLLIGNSTGNTLTKATLIAGSNITITNGPGSITIASTAGSGTVTSVSVVSANGFNGTVATATTTPAITLSTTVTGLVKGNGTALSAAVAATDYVAPSAYASANGLTMATSRLLGRTTASTGAAEEISVAGGLTLSGGVLTGTSGTVTSVSGTGTVNGITLTGTVTSSGNLTLGGTLSNVGLTSQVTGTLPVANGGTGTATAFTTGSVVFAGASGVYSQSNANFFWDNTNARLGLGTTGPSQRLHIRQDLDGTIGLLIQNRNGSGTPVAAVQFVTGGLDLSDNRYAQITAEGGSATTMKFWTSNAGAPTAKLTIAAGGSITALGVYDNTVGATNRAVFVDNTGLLGYVVSILASKTEVNDLTDTSWLYNLRPVSFHYRKRNEEGAYTDEAETPLEYGLIAEEVEIVNPEMVFYDETPEGPALRSVSYSKLVIPMLAELKALRNRVIELEKSVAP